MVIKPSVISGAPLRIPKINYKFGIVISDFKVCVTSHIATNSYANDFQEI
jgi:hypothetical protein